MRRPLQFMTVVWGAEYCEYFVRLCLASLLAPGNIPALARPGDSFLIGTTAADRERMRERPQLKEAERHLTIEYVEIEPPVSGTPSVIHSNKQLVRLLQLAFERKGLGVVMSPDEVFSRELGRTIEQAIADGIGLVLLPTIRLAQEPLATELAKLGLSLDIASERPEFPIDVSSMQLAQAAVASLHPEILAAEWKASCFGDYVNSVWWRVSGADGILLHTFSYLPVLIDFSRIEWHEWSDALISNTDGPYLARNFPPQTPLRIIDDAASVFTVSWAPYGRAHHGLLEPKRLLSLPWLGEELRGAFLRNRYRYYVVECDDWIKAVLFAHPICWRLGGSDQAWHAARREAQRTLARHLPGFDAMRTVIAGGEPSMLNPRALGPCLGGARRDAFDRLALAYQWLRTGRRRLGEYAAVMWSAMRGDRASRRRVHSRAMAMFRR